MASKKEKELEELNKEAIEREFKKNRPAFEFEARPLKEKVFDIVNTHSGINDFNIFTDVKFSFDNIEDDYTLKRLISEALNELTNERRIVRDADSLWHPITEKTEPLNVEMFNATEKWVLEFIVENPGCTEREIMNIMLDKDSSCPLPVFNDYRDGMDGCVDDTLTHLLESGLVRIEEPSFFESSQLIPDIDRHRYYFTGPEQTPETGKEKIEMGDGPKTVKKTGRKIQTAEGMDSIVESEIANIGSSLGRLPPSEAVAVLQAIFGLVEKEKLAREHAICFDVKVGEDGRITIPEATREKYGLTKGKILTVQIVSEFGPRKPSDKKRKVK